MRIKFNENNRLFNIEFRMEEFEIFHNICKTAPYGYRYDVEQGIALVQSDEIIMEEIRYLLEEYPMDHTCDHKLIDDITYFLYEIYDIYDYIYEL